MRSVRIIDGPATPVLVFAVLFIATLAGCLDQEAPTTLDPDDPRDPLVPTASGAKASSALTADDSVAAPEWALGDWFGHHVHLADGPEDGRHYNTVVHRVSEDGWLLAPDDKDAAKEEAVWDLPVAGKVTRGLQTTAFGATWDLFQFPLHDGKTWTGKVQARDMERYDILVFDVTFSVTFDAAIDVNGEVQPGYRIVALDANSVPVVDASYIPSIGWYGHITLLDPRTEDPDDLFLRTVSMGHGTGWTGTYHLAEGGPVTDHFGGFVVFEPDAIAPKPPETFAVPEGTDVLYGTIVAIGWNSASAVAVVDPDGGTRRAVAHHLDPTDQDQGAYTILSIDEPAIPGEWGIASIGAGPVWIAGASLHALHLDTATL